MAIVNPIEIGMPKPTDSISTASVLCIHNDLLKDAISTLGLTAPDEKGILVKHIIATAAAMFVAELFDRHLIAWIVNGGTPNEFRVQLGSEEEGPSVVWGPPQKRADNLYDDVFQYGIPILEWATLAMEYELSGQFPDIKVD